jgi:hypothetical protein
VTSRSASAGDSLETLLERYSATRLGPDRAQLARGRVAMLAADAHPTRAGASTGGVRSRLRGWSLAAVLALLVTATGGLVAAQSGPGQPFYGLRLAVGSLTLPGDEPGHERGLAAQLDDRLSEVGAAARTGDGQGALAAIHEYLNTLRELARNGVNDPQVLALIQRHEDTPQQLLAVAPEQAAGGVQEALDAAGKVDGAASHPTPAPRTGESPPGTGKP